MFKSGFISIIGLPNAGKSTLLNTLMHEKFAIVTSTAQTTRNNIQAVLSEEDAQLVFIDTPGIHKPHHELGKSLNKFAYSAIVEADVFYYVVDASEAFGKGDAFLLERLQQANKPTFLLLNKIDKLTQQQVIEQIQAWNTRFPFVEIFPISAQNEMKTRDLIDTTKKYLNEGPMYYPEDMKGDKDELFYMQEIIREKVILKTKEEVPHSIATKIEMCEEHDNVIAIRALIIVERDSQKGIIVGKQGAMIQSIRMAAQAELKRRYEKKIDLELFVRVEKGWRNKPGKLQQFGYGALHE